MTNPASERQRLVDDLVNQAFTDASPDPDTAVVAAWMRELPIVADVDLAPEQTEAWRELAELATDPGSARSSAPWPWPPPTTRSGVRPEHPPTLTDPRRPRLR